MKRLLCILLTLAMLLTLSACGGGKSGETAPAAPEATAAPEPELSAGDMIGEKGERGYVNKALKIRADLPEDWILLSNEEVAEVMGYTREMVTDEEVAAILDESGAVCDFYAMAADGSGSNLNIQLQSLTLMQGAAVNETTLAEASLDQVKQALESIGMEDVTPTTERFLFAGKEHASIACTATYMGVPLFERQVIVKVGRYIGIVTSFAYSQEDADSYLAFFSAV